MSAINNNPFEFVSIKIFFHELYSNWWKLVTSGVTKNSSIDLFEEYGFSFTKFVCVNQRMPKYDDVLSFYLP